MSEHAYDQPAGLILPTHLRGDLEHTRQTIIGWVADGLLPKYPWEYVAGRLADAIAAVTEEIARRLASA